MTTETDDPNVVGRIHHFLLPADGWGAAADAREVKDLAGEAQQDLKAWRNKIKSKPSKTQVDRMVNLGRRVESLWRLTLRRLQVAEAEARRDIDYFGKQPSVVEPGAAGTKVQAVTREQIEETLNDPNGAYQRLRRVMDAWNALWFWPLTERATGGATPPTLDEWLAALEAILGLQGKESKMTGQQTFGAASTWEELNDAERADLEFALVSDIEIATKQHAWLHVCENIAADQGFFHWELDFASVFGRGGFDLQVGNPPWVRPRSDEASLLAEYDPWWQLVNKPTEAVKAARRKMTLATPDSVNSYVDLAIIAPLTSRYLGDPGVFSVLEGLQPDLYRCFMLLVWRNANTAGTSALVHLESHFTDEKSGALREATYVRIRRHWQFINELHLFEIQDQKRYGVNVYGAVRDGADFLHAVSLFHPETVTRSLKHDGSGPEPGIKDALGNWDLTPHVGRIFRVTDESLRAWAAILDVHTESYRRTPMVYAINKSAESVLEKLAPLPLMSTLPLYFSRGWDESIDRRKGFFDVDWGAPASWADIILQGPHLFVNEPFYKSPNETMLHQQDWTGYDTEAIEAEDIPVTAYRPAVDRLAYDEAYGRWAIDGKRSPRDHYRVAWRSMAANTGERTLIPAIIPPGAAHVHGVSSLGVPTLGMSALVSIAGFMSSLIADFSIRSVPKSIIPIDALGRIPVDLGHTLLPKLLLRTLRLNVLTSAFSELWEEVFDETFLSDGWTCEPKWATVTGLSDVSSTWTEAVPLRRAADRRQAQLECDALVALMLGVSADELCTIYRTQFSVLRGYDESKYCYDAGGRLIASSVMRLYRQRGENLTLEERTWTHPQSGVEYVFEFPFQSFDREEDMRKAYAHFSSMLEEKA